MSLYKSHIYTGIAIPFGVILFSMLLYFVSSALFIELVSWIVIGIGILLFFFSFNWIDKEMFDIFFNEDEIEIKYVLGKKVRIIRYQDVLTYTFIETSKNTNNSFELNNEKFVFNRVVNREQFIEFYNFLKSKNKKIDIKIWPLSSDLEFLRQKEFGCNYRKFIKEAL